MKSNKNKMFLLISLGIHFALMLIISPFLIEHFKEKEDALSFEFFKVDTPEQIKRRVMREHQQVQPKRSTDDGAPTLLRAAPKYAPKVNPPKAPIHDTVVPEIVTFANIPQTNVPAIPNTSFGKDAEAAGPVVDPEYRGAGGNIPGPGRGGTGTGRGSGVGRGLSNVAGVEGVEDLGSIFLDEDIKGLGIFDDDVKPGHGLIGKVYIPGGTFRFMPNFKRMTPLYTFAATNLDVAPRHYTEGFPTPQKQNVLEYFVIHFRGKLAVDTPGTYMFELSSDDGSKLFINGNLVVDNDGLHPTRSSRAHLRLQAGFHPVEIHYFQGPGHSLSLQWYYKPPNHPKQIVPPEVIFHPGKPDDPDELKKIKQHIKKMEK